MLAAYRGTIDDEGESLEDALAETRRTFAGEKGGVLWEASFVDVEGGGDLTLACAAIVVTWKDGPLLAYLMTAPAAKRRGLGERLLGHVTAALRARGDQALFLVVTSGNVPAETLYEKLGFVEIDAR
jgi:ribosomal protein S18 acetylase RimI-like enzyme